MKPSRMARRLERFFRLSGRDLLVALLPTALVLVVATWALLHFVRPAAPRTITISTGPDGSSLQRAAERYQKAFARVQASDRAALLGRLEAIERRADALRIPVGFADSFYVLREHILFVRSRLTTLAAAEPQDR